jgi:hypothetical protein
MSGLIQSTSVSGNNGFDPEVSVSLTDNISAGDCVIVAMYFGNGIQAIQPSSGSDTFTLVSQVGEELIYYCASSSGGYNTIVITANDADVEYAIYVYEISQIIALDVTSTHQTTSGTTWTSNSVTTNYASEFWVGLGQGDSTLTGPSSPWTNTAYNNLGGSGISAIGGYQVVSSAGSASYSGTNSPSQGITALVATFAFFLPTTGFSGLGTFNPTASVTQKLIVSAASEAGTTSDGFNYPAGVGVYGTGGLFAYAGEAVMNDLVSSVTPLAGTDSAGNPYPPGFMGPQLALTENASPATQTGVGILYVDSSGNLWYKSPGGTSTKLASD